MNGRGVLPPFDRRELPVQSAQVSIARGGRRNKTRRVPRSSQVDGAICVVVTYDAGQSRLRMITADSDERESVTEGGSQYEGDIFVDLASRMGEEGHLE